MSNHGSNTPLRVSSDDWAEFVNAGKSLLEESKMRSIKEQEEEVLAARDELERLSEAAEAKMNEWDNLRDKERKQFDAWLVEERLLIKMKGEQNERRD
jgi:hypothetical protein